jgi:peptidoglycan/xylan/chitin deacetylase (PgdA/CDA1 family)
MSGQVVKCASTHVSICGKNLTSVKPESLCGQLKMTKRLINYNTMIRNFLFHRVNPKRDKLWDPMSVELFEKCINYISKKYDVMLFEELVFSNNYNSNNTITGKHEKKIATIMFDDGYKDNIEFAAPILDKYNVKASFYVVTECIDKNIPTWTHILEHLFQSTSIQIIDINFDFLPQDLKISILNNHEDRIKYVRKLKPFLKKISHEKREIVLNRIIETYTDIEFPKLMMNWEDLRKLKKEGHYIGSHTVTHSMLGTMESADDITSELTISGRRIEENLGYFPLTISYPVGSFNKTTKDLAKKAGYKIGLAVKQNIHNPLKDDLFEVSRIEIYNEPWWKTRLRITNTLENIKSLIRYK